MSDQWFTLIVQIPLAQREELEAALWDCSIAGFEEREVDDCIEYRIGTMYPEQLQNILDPALIVAVQSTSPTAGLDEWRQFAKVEKAGRCAIVPTWCEYEPEENEIVVVIDPEYSFGSGSHPTTRLCAELLCDFVQPADSVADIGCGSGVLSVVAAKLGASVVCATDIDPHALTMTQQNAARNEVVVHVASRAEEFIQSSFAIVVANIGAAVLQQLAPLLSQLTNRHLLLSGVLAEQQHDVVSSFSSLDFSLVEERREGEWVAFVLQNARFAR